jgi:3-oxoacyl-[acyl-carrier protein] reductase
MSMDHPVAVVTGSSSGIGAAIALQLAENGYRVILHGNRNKDGLASIQDEVHSIHRRSGIDDGSTVIQADLANVDQIHKFFEAAKQWAGNINVWVNAAGADVITGHAAKASFEEKLDQLWNVDVRGTILLSRLATALMTERSLKEQPARKPTVLNLSWDQADRGMAGDSGQYFAATKGAIAAFTRSLAMSVGPHVRVNCIAPGWIKTKWGAESSAIWQQRAIGESSLHRWGDALDVAKAAVWLCSDQAEFINGQVIAVNGGWQPAYRNEI